MDDKSSSTPPESSGHFAVLTSPVRRFAERAVGRAWPGRHAKPRAAAPAKPAKACLEETPVQSFVTSEVISAFHLQQLRVPNGIDTVTSGAATSGKVAIVASVFALISLVGLGLWANAPTTEGVNPGAANTAAGMATSTAAIAAIHTAVNAVHTAQGKPGFDVSTGSGVSQAEPRAAVERRPDVLEDIERAAPSNVVRAAAATSGQRSSKRGATSTSQGALVVASSAPPVARSDARANLMAPTSPAIPPGGAASGTLGVSRGDLDGVTHGQVTAPPPEPSQAGPRWLFVPRIRPEQ